MARIALLLAFLLLLGCNSSKPVPVSVIIADAGRPPSAPIYVAMEQGFFRKAGLAVQTITCASGREALDVMLEGRADIATVAELPVAIAAIHGRSFTVVATMASTDEELSVISVGAGATPAGLLGQRVGVTAGTASDAFLTAFLIFNGVDPDAVVRVNLPPSQMPAALLAEPPKVAAVAAWFPVNAVLRKTLGERCRELRADGVYTMYWNLAAANHFLRSNPHAADALLRALMSAVDFIRSHPTEARLIVSRRTGIPVPDLEHQWDSYHFDLSLEQSLIASLEQHARWQVRREKKPEMTIPEFSHWVDAAPLERLRPDAVTIIR